MSRATTWQSNIAGQGNTIGCRNWRPNWSAARWPSSLAELQSGGARGQSGDHDHSDRLRGRRRPGQAGLVASLNRPGGNVTGVSFFDRGIGGKAAGLLHELVPGSRAYRRACQSDQSSNAETTHHEDAEAAARRWAGKSKFSRQHQPRDRCGLCELRAQTGRCAASSPRAVLTSAVAFNSSRWRRATGCPRSIPP